MKLRNTASLTESTLFTKKLRLRVTPLVSKIKWLFEFFKDSREELKKVTWPDRDEVTRFTVVVVITVIFISVFLWLIDSSLMALIKVVMN